MTITDLFSKGLADKKFQIDDKLSSANNKVVAVGYSKDGHIGTLIMDRPLRSQHTLELIRSATQNWNAEKSISDMSK